MTDKPGKKKQKPPAPVTSRQTSGVPARVAAHELIARVLFDQISLDEALLACEPMLRPLETRDRAFARAIAATSLRRLGQIEALLAGFLEKPLPERAKRAGIILIAAAAELLFLGVKPHAAVNAAVGAAALDHKTRPLKNLVNAIARRIDREGKEIVEAQDAEKLNTPAWAWESWQRAYGEETARAIASAHLKEPPLDFSVKEDAKGWAARLEGTVLPTGSVRLAKTAAVEKLPGFQEGGWWVQDAAAALPAKMLGDVKGKDVLDLCAAPGGKTAQLAAAGAHVTALDKSSSRLARIRENLKRLSLEAELISADALRWKPERSFPLILLDAPCSATGTARRHPDVLHLKSAGDIAKLADLQFRLLSKALGFLAPGGTLIYCTCSLEEAEGPAQIEKLLRNRKDIARLPLTAAEIGEDADALAPLITAEGDLRTLPAQFESLGGLDGFYAARLKKLA